MKPGRQRSHIPAKGGRSSFSVTLKLLSKDISSSKETLESLLVWSKSDIIQLQPEKKPVDIVAVIENILKYFSQSFFLKEIKVTKSFYSTKAFVQTDENMIKVAIRNIISNAIKYNNKRGELKIKVDLNNNKHEITIEDTGVGITQDYIDNKIQPKIYIYD